MAEDQVGAIIETGPADWQIIQQGSGGLGKIELAGRWVADVDGGVEVRLVWQDTAVPVTARLDWRPARKAWHGRWKATLADVPAGGLYRLETRFRPKGHAAGEWAPRGDMRHFLGVGDLWVIAGQSNSAGYGRGPFFDPPELGIHMLRNSETWALATHPMNESTDTAHPVNREGSNPGHSPYVHFARLLKQQLGHPIGLLPVALGGSPLSAWNPTEPGPSGLFENMVHCVELAGGKVRGILWYQGESDAGGQNALTYADRFTAAVKAWRKALTSRSLPVVTVQLNRVYGSEANAQANRDWTILREAQRQAAGTLPNVAIVPSFDLPLSDAIHTSPAGNMLLAERMARAALAVACGRKVDFRAPEIQSAKPSADGSEIVLRFEPVTSRMDCIDQSANCFMVEDADGAVPITKVVYPQDATVRLALARPPGEQAVVHGACGTNPDVVPIDVERLIPMLGFYGVPVASRGRQQPARRTR